MALGFQNFVKVVKIRQISSNWRHLLSYFPLTSSPYILLQVDSSRYLSSDLFLQRASSPFSQLLQCHICHRTLSIARMLIVLKSHLIQKTVSETETFMFIVLLPPLFTKVIHRSVNTAIFTLNSCTVQEYSLT